MRVSRTGLCVAALIVFHLGAKAAPVVVFPKAGHLASPDGRFVVRNSDANAQPLEFVGAFHSLLLEETASGRTRKLCDYVGVAAVAWTKNNLLIMTEYLSRRTSRALIFAADNSRETVVIDQPLLITLVPVDLRPQLRENDHVFVEAIQIEEQTMRLGVWGYGRHDVNGFRWRCEYNLGEGSISCAENNSALSQTK